MSIESITAEIKDLLKDITVVTDKTERDDSLRENIDLFENPLDPNLLAYCFDIILGFDVQYRIFEKVNYTNPYLLTSSRARDTIIYILYVFEGVF